MKAHHLIPCMFDLIFIINYMHDLLIKEQIYNLRLKKLL